MVQKFEPPINQLAKCDAARFLLCSNGSHHFVLQGSVILMASTQANILIFDSGVGGLSIVNHINQLLPDCSSTYLADNALFPYGMLDEQTLVHRVCHLIKQCIAVNKPDIIVIACNSASTLALPHLRKLIDIPVVGVVPAIKPAATQSDTKVIGLLATPGTIKRDYTDELISEFANDCEIVRLGSSKLVEIVEQKMAGQAPSKQQLNDVLQPFRAHAQWQKMDTIVLACTHFPLIQQEIAAVTPEICYWVDSGDAIARRIKFLLPNAMKRPSKKQRSIAMFTELAKVNESLKSYFSEYGFEQLQQL